MPDGKKIAKEGNKIIINKFKMKDEWTVDADSYPEKIEQPQKTLL